MDERDRLRSLFEVDLDDEDTFVPRVLPVAPPTTADRIPSKHRRSAGASMLAATCTRSCPASAWSRS